jgi:hypothetical protein
MPAPILSVTLLSQHHDAGAIPFFEKGKMT